MTRWVLAVDLGTSYSTGAVADADRVELLEVAGERRLPSTVLLTEEGRLLAGTFAQRAVARSPDRAERNPKRYVGRAPMLLGGAPVTATDALAAVLDQFVTEARRRHDATVPARLVLTHPVAWTDAQRGELRAAAERVLPRVEVALLDEPVAAAVHYVHDRAAGGDVAVYDLGGGTLDTAVLTAERGGFRVRGRPGGAPDIGGEAFDQLVHQHFGTQLAVAAPQWWERVRTDPGREWLAAAADLLTDARLAKESLTHQDRAVQYIAGADCDVELTRAEFDELIGPDVTRSVALLAETVEVAGGEVRSVFLAGGASRTPLVEKALRERFGGLVRTWQDPKTVVALGAARWGLEPRRVPPGRAAPGGPRPGGRLTPIADGVRAAMAGAGAVYTCSDAPGPGRRIARRDPRTGTVDREVVLGPVATWAVSDAGVVVAERAGGVLRLQVLGTDLGIRSTIVLPTTHDPFLAVDGELAWAVLRSPDMRPAGRGEVGELAVQAVRFGPGARRPVPPVALGRAAFRFLDGPGPRVLDPAVPTTVPPTAEGASCVLVVGRPARDGRGADHQVVGLIDPAGAFTPVIEQRFRDRDTPWVHQLLRPAAGAPWLLATSVGLETYGDLRRGTDRRLFLPRPRAGATCWVRAGRRVYGLAVESAVDGRGLSLHALVDGRRRDLGRWPSLLGTPLALHPAQAPRTRPDGDRLWVAAGDGAGGSQLLLADPVAARVVASAPGRLEPVGRVAGAALALHVPPGAAAGALVRLPD